MSLLLIIYLLQNVIASLNHSDITVSSLMEKFHRHMISMYLFILLFLTIIDIDGYMIRLWHLDSLHS